MHKILKLLIILLLISVINVEAKSLNCNYTITYGSTGENVKVLQKMLNNKMNCNLTVDGIFGNQTAACVKKYQSKNNLAVDGIVRINTCSKLKGIKVVTTSTKNISSPVSNNRAYVIKSTSIVDRNGTYLKSLSLGNKVKVLASGKSSSRVQHGSVTGYLNNNSITNNVIITDISDQKLYYFKGNKQILNSSVVTGMKGRHDTPRGTFIIGPYNRARKVTLRGRNDDGSKYASYVEYWMPFYGGYGFHDADGWRSYSEYTQSTYRYNGSHGCVNMKRPEAKKMYENLTKQTIVIIKK